MLWDLALAGYIGMDAATDPFFRCLPCGTHTGSIHYF
jgi:hypothetical protein